MLKKETKELWDQIFNQKVLDGFVLVGGTALSIRINHRVSEDIDLAWGNYSLPRGKIDIFLRDLASKGNIISANNSSRAIEEFFDSGLDLLDYQQDFIVNDAVKLTFFAPDNELLCQFEKSSETGLRIATMKEIFRLKCMASANRSKTRDWLDLYVMLRDHNFCATDYIEPFDRSNLMAKLDIAMTRICSGIPDQGDEGYENLLDSPPSISEMIYFFKEIRSEIEVELLKRKRMGQK